MTVPPGVAHLAAQVDCPECWPTVTPHEVEVGLWEIEVIHGPQCNEPTSRIYA